LLFLLVVCLFYHVHTWRLPSRPKHVVKESNSEKPTYNKAARRRRHNI
jgi:hypothetical protein